ncbi:zinc-finger domain-containing protein [Staphylococcus lutrae]|uniref:Zinc-finger domain-containing protein n=1 Tax=Staphylococcus lutrae TaxID=155085 RepID=A0AAC9RQ40_9STAP|nr:zinc-finger domain-containing protein [Staphylococcus lutrae]ARJ52043.1 hypothetical protein B5P37_11255 [Staphylococcus lutrae]PNZ36099.1 zinc-finger domain-containing protein [Staphylococcus lutrae]
MTSIDRLSEQYCDQCLIKTHLRKVRSKTQAHHFCINECSIGKQIQQLGKALQ